MTAPSDTKGPCWTCSRFGGWLPVKLADHPGSTYYAAELRNDIDDANRVATEMELPFRFRSAGPAP